MSDIDEKNQIIQSLVQQLNDLTMENLERMKTISRYSNQLVVKESEVIGLMNRVRQYETHVRTLNDQIQKLTPGEPTETPQVPAQVEALLEHLPGRGD